MASKPRRKSRPRASNEIDVIPPEVFATGDGVFSRQEPRNEKAETSQPNHQEYQTNNRPSLPQQTDEAPIPKAPRFHKESSKKNHSRAVAAHDNHVKNNNSNQNEQKEEQKQVEDGVVIITIGERSDHSHPIKVELPAPTSRRALMNKNMSEITLNASQHPEPKKDDIVLTPRSSSRHSRKSRGVFKSPISPKRRLVTAVLRQLYPDFDGSQSTDKDKVRHATSSDHNESDSSVGEYDGFEVDSYHGDDDRDELNVSTRSQSSQVSAKTPRQLTHIAEEDDSEEESGPLKRMIRPASLFSRQKRVVSASTNDRGSSSRSTKFSGKKFHIPSFKRVSVRGIFSIPSRHRRDGTSVAAG